MYKPLLIILYSCALLIASFWGIKNKVRLSFQFILLIGALLRLIVSLSFIELTHYDTISYDIIGKLTLAGKTIYPAFAYYHYPYFPGFNYIEAISIFFNQLGFPYMLFLKLLFSTFDVINIFLIYALSKKNIQIAFLYAVNPAMIFVSAAHGQLEAIPIMLSLLSILLYQKSNELTASFTLGFAIVSKVWPLLFLPFFLKYSKKWWMYIFSLVIPLIFIISYSIWFQTPLLSILHPPFSYRGGYGSWGISTVVHLFLPGDTGINNTLYKSITSLTIIALMVFMLSRKKTYLLRELFIFMLIFGASVLSGANPLWLIPFMLLMRPLFWGHWLSLTNIYYVIIEITEIMHINHSDIAEKLINLGSFLAFLLWITNIAIVIKLFRLTKFKLRN